MVKAIIFDLFGVIITDALEELMAPLHAADPAAEAKIVELVHDASAGRIDPDESRAAVAAILGLSVEEYKHRIRTAERRDGELLAYIAALRHSYQTALLTNILPGGLSARFAPGELANYFDVIVASCDIGFEKPQPQAYILTAQKLGVDPAECLMVDDRMDYCRGAERTGMIAIQYQSVDRLKEAFERLPLKVLS